MLNYSIEEALEPEIAQSKILNKKNKKPEKNNFYSVKSTFNISHQKTHVSFSLKYMPSITLSRY